LEIGTLAAKKALVLFEPFELLRLKLKATSTLQAASEPLLEARTKHL
jgi:hypothetical protein